MVYKLTDALRIYHYWVNLEEDFNETKLIMMIAYVIGIVMSAIVSAYMFDGYFKRQSAKRDEDNEKEKKR